MTQHQDQYDLNVIWAAIAALEKTLDDGLAMLRLIGPDLDPEYNDQVGVAQCRCPEQMVCETNRGGKTMVCAAKIAAAARNVPLITWDGKEVDCRPPHQKDKPLVIWIIGQKLSHIGQTIFRLLFKPGAFRVIPDEHTGVYRAWQPWRKYDDENAALCVSAPPLIPPSEIDHDTWEWESRAGNQVASVKLNNGTTFFFYASTADVKQGDPVDIVWIDEQINYSDHYAEWWSRLTDYSGWIIWSTMLRGDVPAIARVLEREENQLEEITRGELKEQWTKVFRFRQSGNPFLPKERVELNREMYASEGDEQVALRLEGGNPFTSTIIYPFFNKRIHTAIPADETEYDTIARVLSRSSGLPPADWTHELIIDLGAAKPAVLFGAVPPQHWTDPHDGREYNLWAESSKPYLVPYDEIYGQRFSLKELVPIIKRKMRGIRFRRFIIDNQAARQTPLHGGLSYKQRFSNAFAQNDIFSEETGNGFIAGGTDFPTLRALVTETMQELSSGKPQLRIVTQNCPNLVSQLARNQLKVVGAQVVNMEARKEKNDLRKTLEYWISRNPQYVEIKQQQQPQWVNRMRTSINEIFGGWKDEEARCHFGPGLAPRGSPV